MAIQLDELPPGLTLAQLQTALNDRIRNLNALLLQFQENPSLAALAMNNQRITALADPKDDLDAVNLRTLRSFNVVPSTPR